MDEEARNAARLDALERLVARLAGALENAIPGTLANLHYREDDGSPPKEPRFQAANAQITHLLRLAAQPGRS